MLRGQYISDSDIKPNTDSVNSIIAIGYTILCTMEKRIKQARNEAGLSQAELARRMYLTQSSVAEWESGRKSPSVKHLIRLAMLLGVSFEWLSTGRGEMRAASPMQETAPGIWAIPDDERQLLNCYARLAPPQRAALLTFLQSLAA